MGKNLSTCIMCVSLFWDLLNLLFLLNFVFLSIGARLLRPSVSLTNAILLGGGMED